MRWQELIKEARRRVRGRNGQAQVARRRAVSDAYYALFHCVTSILTKRIIGASSLGLAERLERSFQHATMKKAAVWCLDFPHLNLQEPQKSAISELLTAAPGKPPTSIVTADMRVAAQAFKDLQEARHRADYATHRAANFTHTDAVTLIDQARDGCLAFDRAKKTAEGRTMLALMLIGGELAPRR